MACPGILPIHVIPSDHVVVYALNACICDFASTDFGSIALAYWKRWADFDFASNDKSRDLLTCMAVGAEARYPDCESVG